MNNTPDPNAAHVTEDVNAFDVRIDSADDYGAIPFHDGVLSNLGSAYASGSIGDQIIRFQNFQVPAELGIWIAQTIALYIRTQVVKQDGAEQPSDDKLY